MSAVAYREKTRDQHGNVQHRIMVRRVVAGETAAEVARNKSKEQPPAKHIASAVEPVLRSPHEAR
jgi:hypothetical protein